MCLKTVGVALDYDKQAHAFIGYGYKRMNPLIAKKHKKWVRANGDREYLDKNSKLSSSYVVSDSDYKSYVPGFHIWINEEDAQDYEHGDGPVVKVKYKGIIAFGQNSLDCYDKNAKDGPCVVAEWMKLA
jgi:hypothetical protein